MPELELGELVDCGIDWITTTSTDRPTSELLTGLAHRLMMDQVRGGFYERPWVFRGYSGWRAGHVEYGMRSDEAIVRMGGLAAANYWWDVYQITDRCTRLDLQATYRPPDGDLPFLLELHALARKWYSDWAKPPSITLWTDNVGGASVYLGSRKSDLYFRAYAKYAQSRDDAFRGCVRLELEVKNRLCKRAIAFMCSDPNPQASVLRQLGDYLQVRGISTKLRTDNPRSYYERPTIGPDCLKSLQWLSQSVEPTISRLIGYGLRDEVINVLGLL